MQGIIKRNITLLEANINYKKQNLCCGLCGQIDILEALSEDFKVNKNLIKLSIDKLVTNKLTNNYYKTTLFPEVSLYDSYNSLFFGNAGAIYILLIKYYKSPCNYTSI